MIKLRIKERIESSRPYRAVRIWAKKHSLPGFEGIPVYSVLRFIQQELHRDNIVIRSNAMAFSFFISLFPSIMVVFTLLPFLPIKNLVQTFEESVTEFLPDEAAEVVIEAIQTTTTESNGGLLSFSLFLSLLFASNGMLTMLRGFEKQYEISYRSRGALAQRITALKLTFIVGGIFIASLIIIVVGRVILDALLHWAHIDMSRYNAILLVRWVAIFILFYAGISATYRFGPAMKKRIKFFSPGATLATLLSIVSSILFSYYVSTFGRYNELYGSLGAIIILMLWMQINSLIILIGYELNASIKINKDLVELEDPGEAERLQSVSSPQR